MTEEQITPEEQTDTTTPDTFPRAYVEELRREAAEHRTRAAVADTFRDALRAAVLEKASTGVLAEPIEWDDEFDGEDGLPDAEKIKAAAEALALEKPWLSRPHGDAGQGFRGEDCGTVDLAGLLRAGA